MQALAAFVGASEFVVLGSQGVERLRGLLLGTPTFNDAVGTALDALGALCDIKTGGLRDQHAQLVALAADSQLAPQSNAILLL